MQRLAAALALLALLGSAAAMRQPGDGASLGRRFGGGAAATAAPHAGRGLVLGGRRYRLALRYTACTGLVNQQYSHIAAFTLAAALGVSEVHLPPAAVRDSFGHKFSVHQEQNQMQWFPARASCLLDVERLQQAWAELGVAVVEVRRAAGVSAGWRRLGRLGAGRQLPPPPAAGPPAACWLASSCCRTPNSHLPAAPAMSAPSAPSARSRPRCCRTRTSCSRRARSS